MHHDHGVAGASGHIDGSVHADTHGYDTHVDISHQGDHVTVGGGVDQHCDWHNHCDTTGNVHVGIRW